MSANDQVNVPEIPHLTPTELLPYCIEIAQHFADLNIDLSVRTVFYRLVSRGLIPPDMEGEYKNYKRVVKCCAAAKKEGKFPLEWLKDNLRIPNENDMTTNIIDVEDGLNEVREIFGWLPYSAIRTVRWYGQPRLVFVMAEKDTLEGTIRRPCEEADIPWFICRGFSSFTGLTAWVETINNVVVALDWEVEEMVILYLGDHDPDGIGIPVAAKKYMAKICELQGYEWPEWRFERVALTQEQAQALGPVAAPSIGVKMKSPRAPAYVKLFGDQDAWEIEVLGPVEIQTLLTEAIDFYFDNVLYERLQSIARTKRRELTGRILEVAQECFGEVDDES